MFLRVVQYMGKVLVATHAFLWATVVSVWIFAWHHESPPMGPTFNFAKRFISRIDALISPQTDELSVSLAMQTAKWSRVDLSLAYSVLFGCLILLSGTLQWYLLGRLLQFIASKYGQTSAIVFTVGIGCWLTLASVSWAMTW